MFKANGNHVQPPLFSPGNVLPEVLRKRLDRHWSTAFYWKVFRHIDERLFQRLYSETGRPNFPVNILVGLELLKELHGLSDEQLYDRYHFDYTYQRAVGVERIEEHTFVIRTLYHFRAAVAEYEERTGANLYLEVFRAGRDRIIEELGVKTSAQRIDSVMIGANIKRMNRLSLFHRVFANVVRELEGKKIPVSEKYTGLLKDDEDGFCYRLPREKVGDTLEMIGNYLRELMLDHASALRGSAAYENAVRLLGEQAEVESGRVKPRSPDKISSGSMQNPSDPDATFHRKRDEEHRGYSTHAAETCDPDNKFQVITHIETVRNNVDDADVLAKELPHLKDETGLEAMIVDGGFVSSGVREACDALNVELIASAIRGTAQAEDALTSVDFQRDERGMVSSCPAGHAPVRRGLGEDGTLTAVFAAEQCRACPLKDRCIAHHAKGNGRIKIDIHRQWLDERRARMGDESYRRLMGLRPPVESLMEKLKPKYLSGRTQFRGLTKVRSRMILRGMTVNFRRYYLWLLLSFLKLLGDFAYPANLRLPALQNA